MVSRATVGLVILIVGVLIFVGAEALPQNASANVPAGDGWELTATTVGAATVDLSWSGGSSGTNVTLFDCGSGCPSGSFSPTSVPVVATGRGGSGSFTVSLTPGHTYAFIETAGSSTLSVSYSVSGLTLLGVIGIVVAAVGMILVVLPPKARQDAPAPDPATYEETPPVGGA